jgi:hypothetical protein
MKRIVLVLMVLALALGLAWRLGGGNDEPEAAESLPRAPALVDAEPELAAPADSAPSESSEREDVKAGVVEAAPAVVTAEQPSEPQLTLVFGRVLPPRGEETFAEAPSCGLHDETGTRRKVECAEDGAFAISGVAAGRYWLHAGDPTGAAGCVEFELAVGVEQREINVTLERPWSVEVRVRSTDGRELKALWSLVVATLEPLEEWFHEPSGSSSNPYGVGSFRPARLGQAEPGTDVRGTLLIKVESPVWVHLVYGHRVLARQRISPPQSVVEFVVDPEDPAAQSPTLRGRLLDAETGEPLGSVQVMVVCQAAGLHKTDGDGRFEVSGLLVPGFCRVSMRGTGYAWDQLLKLEPGVDTDLGDIRVERGLSIEGKVFGALGSERNRTVRYEELDELSGELVWNGMRTIARIEADGSFKIGALLPRRYQLTIEGGGDTARQRHVVDLRNGSITGLEYVLQRASTLSVVLDLPGRRLEELEIRDDSGALVMAPKLRPGPPQAFKLAPGSYTLKLGDVERSVVLGSEPLLVRMP